jgi:hypothetical protein
MKIIAMTTALLLAFASAVHAAEPAPPTAEAVAEAFHAALKKGDRDAALASLDDKVQIYEQGWVERSKAEYASSHLASDIKFTQATSSSQTSRTVEVVNDLAFVTSEGRTTGSFEGKPVDSITLETMVLRHTKAGWRIVHIHWSSRKPKA